MKLVLTVLFLILVVLQYRLWVGEGSIAHQVELDQKIEEQQSENQILKDKNDRLALEVDALKNDPQAIESRARHDLGLIKEGETFFMLVDPEENQKPN